MFKSEPQGQLAKDLVGLAERVGVGQLVLQLELGIFLLDATCRQHRKGPRSFMRYVFRVCEPVPIAQTPLAK
ncbi:hypothetical protein PC119_g4966 [Phytophthora cactorum]|nr:hypothetical protein PC119_g4966 [Phytophthora cactorum]